MDPKPLRLGFEFGFGKRGVRSTSRSAAIMRPFSVFVEDGGRVGGVTPVFLDPRVPVDETLHANSIDPPNMTNGQAFALREAPARVFGCFAHTPGGRLCFYPGLQSLDVIGTRDNEGPRESQSMRIHHFTLEHDRRSWHITGYVRDEEVKMPEIRHTWRFDWGVRWFAMTVPTAADFENLAQWYEVNMGAAPAVLRARAGQEFVRSMAGSRLLAPGDARTEEGPYAWHFEIHVARRADDMSPANAPAILPGAIATNYAGRRVFRRAHPIPTPGFSGTVWLNASLVSGELAEMVTTHNDRSGRRQA